MRFALSSPVQLGNQMTHFITSGWHPPRSWVLAFSTIFIVILFVFLSATNLAAGKIYTWTDESGALHITEKPPPKNAKLRDTIKYQSEPRNPSAYDEDQQGLSEELPTSDEEQQESPDPDERVEKAKKEAFEARTRAEEAARREKEYIDKLGRNKKMQRRNKYKLDKAAEYVKATEEQARLAEERASEAEEETETALSSQ